MTDHERFSGDSPDSATSQPVKDNKVQGEQAPSGASEQHPSNDRGAQGKGTHGRPSDDSDPGHS